MDLLGPLKLQLLARCQHLFIELCQRIAHIPFEKPADLISHLRIDRFIDRPDAGAQTLSDVIIQALFFRQLAAFAQRIHAVDKLHHVISCPGIRIRAEICRLLVSGVAHHFQPRRFFPRQLEIRIRLVIHEHDVEGRRMLLDQIDLQQQRLFLTACHDILKVIDVGHEPGRLQIMRADKILPHPVLEHLGLSDIDDIFTAVLHEITARQGRQDRQLVRDLVHVSHFVSFPSASARPRSHPVPLRPVRPCGSSPLVCSASDKHAPPCAARRCPCHG